MGKILRRVFLGFGLLVLSLPMEASAFRDPNVCSGNLELDGDLGSALGPGVLSGNFVGAGDDGIRASCGTFSLSDVAYTWTAPLDATYLFDTLGSQFHTTIILFDPTNGDCEGSGTCNFNNDPDGPREPVFLFAGDKRAILLEATQQEGDFVFNIEATERSAGALNLCADTLDNDQDGLTDLEDNDCLCNGNIKIDGDLGSALGPAVASGNFVGAGNDGIRASCGTFSLSDFAYTWTAPSDGTYLFDTLGSQFHTTIIVFDPTNGNCEGSGTCNFQNDPDGPREPIFFFAGDKRVILLEATQQEGEFVFNIEKVTEETGFCGDHLDNDNDGLQNCADPDCEGQSCDAQNSCIEGSVCSSGECVGGEPQVCPDLSCRVAVACTPGSGCQYTDAEDGASCEDGSLCTQGETCLGGGCQGGSLISCDDQNPCTRDDCSSDAGCVHVPIDVDDGDACTVDTCDASGGPVHTPVNCDDGNACNGAESCNPSNGQCLPGTPVTCDDGNACNGLEVCEPSNGKCAVGTPVVCDDGDQCNGQETCDPSTGACLPGTPVVCDDGNQCNGLEVCEPSNGKCAVGTPLDCDDDNVCNGGETCDPVSGCQPGEPLDCQDGEACNGVEICHPSMGCQSGSPHDCEDNDPCTADSCDELVGCRHEPLPDGDGDGICDANDACPGDSSNDADLDGVCGDVDNCPEDSNADQTDTDNDGIGDACDTGGEPDACSVDFSGLPNSHCSRTTTVKSMAQLQSWISGPRTTNLKVSRGNYSFNGADLNIETSCGVRFEAGATFLKVGDADITASEIVIQNDIVFSPDGTMHLRAGRLIEVRRASLAKLSVTAESPVVLYRGDVNDKMDGLVALCGRYVEIGAASTTKAAKVFLHATHDLIIGGDILSAGQVTLISDDDMELRTSNNIGTFHRPIGNLTAQVAGHFENRGDIVADGTVTINTGSFTLNRSHFFDVDGECRLTGDKKSGSRRIQGRCNPGIQ